MSMVNRSTVIGRSRLGKTAALCGAFLGLILPLAGCGAPLPGGDTDAACPVRLKFEGNIYYGNTTDQAASGDPVDRTAVIPPCEDGNTEVELTSEPIQIASIPGVDVSEAFLAPSYQTHSVFMRKSLSEAEAEAIVEAAIGK